MEFGHLYQRCRSAKDDTLVGLVHIGDTRLTACGMSPNGGWWVTPLGDKPVACKKCLAAMAKGEV